jgi:oligopeptide/dipeptide ABC transporter ATP-binding protein
MYLGKIMEMAPRAQLFAIPAHPYTHALIDAAMPEISGENQRIVPGGDVPSPSKPTPSLPIPSPVLVV